MTARAPRPGESPEHEPGQLVVWHGLARRFIRLAVGGAVAGLLAFAIAILAGSSTPTAVGTAIGVFAGVVIVTGVVVVARSAFRGMLRAGERGERLAGDDVGLIPPRHRPLATRRERAADDAED